MKEKNNEYLHFARKFKVLTFIKSSLFISIIFFFGWQYPQFHQVKLEVCNLQQGGNLMMAVYDNSDDFLSDIVFLAKSEKVIHSKSQIIEFELPVGSYAFAVYQDINENGVLDKNFIGIPIEPYGFSGENSFRLGPPEWKDCLIDVSSAQKINIFLTD